MANALPDIAVSTPGNSVVIPVLANDNGPNLSIIGVDYPAHGSVTVEPDESITYTPDPDFSGDDSFSYSVRDDNGDTASALVTVHVEIPNLPPAANDDIAELFVDTDVIIPILSNDSDPDGDQVSLTAVTLPAHGSIDILPDHSLHYMPDPGFSGVDSLTYQVSDGRGGLDEASIVLHVDPMNLPPLAVEDEVTLFTNSSVLINMLGNDSDPDGGAIELLGYALPGHGSLELNSDYSITYTPDPDFIGHDNFEYTIRDSAGLQATAGVQIEVIEINEDPLAVMDVVDVEMDTSATIYPLLNDSDPDGDLIRLIAISFPAHGSIAINPDQSIVYTPMQGFLGSDSFTYDIDDHRGGTATTSVQLFVNEAPGGDVHANGYLFCRQLIIPPENVHGTSHQGFPLWVDLKADWLRSMDHGGDIRNIHGYDLRFELNDGTKLPHETEVYDPLEGILKAWVRVSQLNGETPNFLKIYYGRPGSVAPEADAALVWQDYEAVWHMPGTSDSSPHQRDLVQVGTLTGSDEGMGKGAVRLDGSSLLRLDDTSWLSDLPAFTLQCSSKSDDIGHDHGQVYIGEFDNDADSDLVLRYDATGFGAGGPQNVIHAKFMSDTGNIGISSDAHTQSSEMQRIALTWQTGGDNPVLSINGETRTPSFANHSGGTKVKAIDKPLYIGAGTMNSAAGGWVGLIDEVRIRSTSLSGDWLRTETANYDAPDLFMGLGDAEASSDTGASIIALPLTLETEAGVSIDLDVLAKAHVPENAPAPIIHAVTQPETGTVDIINNQLRYSPAQGQTGEDDFTYTLQSGDKQSTARIRIEISSANTVDPEYPEPLRTVTVSSRSELESAISTMLPGDEIICEDGSGDTYGTNPLLINRSGSREHPIVIRARNRMSARLPGFNIKQQVSDIRLQDFDLRDTKNSYLRGKRNWVIRCWLRPYYNPSTKTGSICIQVEDGTATGYADACRIAYCNFELHRDEDTNGWVDSIHHCVRGRHRGTADHPWHKYLVIERFRLIGGPTRNNYHQPNGEFIEDVETESSSFEDIHWHVLWFYGEDLPTRETVIDSKASGVTYGYGTIHTTSGKARIQNRQGGNARFYSISGDVHLKFHAGPNIKVHDCDINAPYLVRAFNGKIPWDTVGTNGQKQCKDITFGNITGSTSIEIGSTFSSSYNLPPDDCKIEGTIPDGGYAAINGATVERNNQPVNFTPVTQVIVDPDTVGINAPWAGVTTPADP